MTDAVLHISGLSVSFPRLIGAVDAIRDVTFDVRRGEIVGLVGESGSGKSVTAAACLGLVPEPGRITGSIEVCGRQVVGRSDVELAGLRGGDAAMIFQNPATSLNPFFTIGQQMTDIVARRRRVAAKEATDICVQALSDVRIADPQLATSKYPHQFSGGQLQRVMIAIAISCRPRLLIADEPTTALDVTIQAQILVLIRQLVERDELSVLFITHDLGVVATLCDRVVVMYAGTLAERSGVYDLFGDPAHPYTERLLRTVPQLGATSGELMAIAGQVPDLSRPIPGCVFAPRCDRASDVCRTDRPVMRNQGTDRSVACHHILGEASNDRIGGVA